MKLDSFCTFLRRAMGTSCLDGSSLAPARPIMPSAPIEAPPSIAPAKPAVSIQTADDIDTLRVDREIDRLRFNRR